MVVTQNKDLFLGELGARLKAKPNIEILYGQVKAIVGKQTVEALRVLDLKENREVELSLKGVFVALGGAPMTEIVKKAGLETDLALFNG